MFDCKIDNILGKRAREMKGRKGNREAVSKCCKIKSHPILFALVVWLAFMQTNELALCVCNFLLFAGSGSGGVEIMWCIVSVHVWAPLYGCVGNYNVALLDRVYFYCSA